MNRLADAGVVDLQEGAVEVEALLGGKRRWRRRPSYGRGAGGRLGAVVILEEEARRHAEDVGNRLKTAGADAVGALLELLNLLEGHAETVGKRFLAHAHHEAAQADAGTDENVDRVRGFLCSWDFLPLDMPGHGEMRISLYFA